MWWPDYAGHVRWSLRLWVVGLLPCAVEHAGASVLRTDEMGRRMERLVGHGRCKGAALADGRWLLPSPSVAGRRLLGVMQICDGWRDGGRCRRREGGVVGIGSWLIVVEAELVAADGFYLSSPKMLDGVVDPDLEKGAALPVDEDGRRRVDADGNGGRRRDLVIAVILWGPEHRIGGWPEMRRTTMAAIPNEDVGAPNPVLRWCTQICVPGNVDFAL
ncbi:hypothetical protein ACLOJK_007324 [Asimina triloba]